MTWMAPSRSTTVASLGLVLAGLLAAAPVVAQNKPVARPPATPAATTAPAGLDAARVVYEALPLDRRIAVQTGLVWTGDYSGALDGTFGRMTFEAIAAFQARQKLPPDGILTDPAQKALAQAVAKKQAEVGWQMVADAATGTRIGLPAKLVEPGRPIERGTRWVSRDQHVSIRVVSLRGWETAELFEKLKTLEPGQKSDYAVLRGDWFVVTYTDTRRDHYSNNYLRFVRVDGEMRGFMIGWDAVALPEFERVVIAIAGTFEPTGRPTPIAATPSAPTTPTGPSTPTPQTPPTTPVATPVPAGIAATATVVGPDRAVTALAAVDACKSLTVSGRPATVAARDEAHGLAVVAVSGTAASATLRVATARPAVGAPATVAAAAPALTATAADMAERGLRAALQRGGLGAPVFDATGRLAGVVTTAPDERRLIAGLVPQATYPIAAPADVAALATGNGGSVESADGGDALTTGGILAAVGPRILPVVCTK